MLAVGIAVSLLVSLPLAIVVRGGNAVAFLLIPLAVFAWAVARRQPWNPVGTILLLQTFTVVASADLGQYAVLRYRDGHRGLPLARAAVVLAPGTWMWLVIFLPLPLALFPDGRLSRGWRRLLWAQLTVGAAFAAITFWQGASGILARQITVNREGELTSGNPPAFLEGAYTAVILSYLGFSIFWAARLLLDYRRSTGEYRQQLKWLFTGGSLAVIGLMLEGGLNSSGSALLRTVGNVGLAIGLFAFPISLGVAIFRYRLYDIDRLVSRTISYLIVTGSLAGLFAAIVLFATRVLPVSSPVAVAASTLTAAFLFNPLRLRVQRLVDRRFNRARYDADTTTGTFARRLREAVDLDTVHNELIAVINLAVQPATTSVWIQPPTHAPAAEPAATIRTHRLQR